MENYSKVDIMSYEFRPFEDLHEKWMLITAAKKDGTVNTMTASWGGFGIMWDKPTAILTVRPQRFTKEFLDEADGFSLTFFGDSYKK